MKVGITQLCKALLRFNEQTEQPASVWNKKENVTTSVSGNAPNLCPSQRRRGRSTNMAEKGITQPSSKPRLKSKCVFPPKWVAHKWARGRYFCGSRSGGVVRFKRHPRRENVARRYQTIISQTSSPVTSSETKRQSRERDGLGNVQLLMCGDWQAGTSSCFDPRGAKTERWDRDV